MTAVISIAIKANCQPTTDSSISNELNYNQRVPRQIKSSNIPDQPDDRENAAQTSRTPPTSSETDLSYCLQVSSYLLRLDQPIVQTSTVHYLDILIYIVNNLNVLASSSLMRKDENTIVGTGPSAAVECWLSQASYGIGTFDQTNPDYFTVKKEPKLLNALFLKREEKIKLFAKNWGILDENGYTEMLSDFLHNDTGLPIDLDFINQLNEGVSFLWVSKSGLTTEMPETYECQGKFTNLEIETEKLFQNIASFINTLENIDKSLHTESMKFIQSHLTKCGIDVHKIIRNKTPPAYKSMQSCLLTEKEINQHLREKRAIVDSQGTTFRTKRSPDVGLNNHLLEFKLDSFSESELVKVNDNFGKLFSGQNTILDDLARLTVSMEALTSKKKQRKKI